AVRRDPPGDRLSGAWTRRGVRESPRGVGLGRATMSGLSIEPRSYTRRISLPEARGPIGARLFPALRGAPRHGVDLAGVELPRLVAEDDGPSLSRYLERQGSIAQMIEHVIHRSAYQLKEADPHSWAIPRLSGAAKAALLEIQFDEYGEGHAERMHATLF